jgi:protein TonB
MAGATLEGAVSGPLGPALAVSIALHAALLAGLPDFWTSSDPPAPSPLTAWLAPGIPPARISELPQTEVPEPAVKPAPRPRSTARPAPTMREVAPTAEREVPAQVAAPAVQEANPAERVSVATSASASGPKSGPAPAPAETSVALAAPAGEAPPDLGSLAQYRLALIGVAKRHKTYPPRAIDRGLEGRVDVRLVIGTDGALARALVKRSSGHDVLDDQALELMRTASGLTPVPPALRNREFAVEVPVLYELKEAR